jgi:hypothetical protein
MAYSLALKVVMYSCKTLASLHCTAEYIASGDGILNSSCCGGGREKFLKTFL